MIKKKKLLTTLLQISYHQVPLNHRSHKSTNLIYYSLQLISLQVLFQIVCIIIVYVLLVDLILTNTKLSYYYFCGLKSKCGMIVIQGASVES